MKTRVTFLVSLVAVGSIVGACEKRPKNEKISPLSPAERAQFKQCIDALGYLSADRHGEVAPQDALFALVKGCGAANGLDRVLHANAADRSRALSKDTDLLCSEKVSEQVADLSPDARLPALVRGCGAAYYGLTDATARHFSLEWFLAQRSAAWAVEARGRADKGDVELMAAYDAAADRFALVLMPPSQTAEGTQLVFANDEGERPTSTEALWVTKEGLVLSPFPRMLMSSTGVTLAEGVSRPMTLEELGQRSVAAKVDQVTEPQPTDDTATGSNDRAEPQGLKRKLQVASGGEGQAGSLIAVLGAADSTGLDGYFGEAAAKGLASIRTVQAPADNALVVLAERDLPAQRLLDVIDVVRNTGAYIAVSTGWGAGVATVAFGRSHGKRDLSVAGLAAQIQLNEEGITLWLFGKSSSVPKRDGKYDWPALETTLRESGSSGTVVMIAASATTATAQDVLDASQAAGRSGMRLATTGKVGNESFGGSGDFAALGDIGHGGGNGVGGAPSYDRDVGRATALVKPGVPTVVGDLDKEIIRRYVRQKLANLRYCYEKQLVLNPKLSGEVTAKFVIAPMGNVMQVTALGMGEEMEACVKGVIKSLMLPKPKGGGMVEVEFPFTFAPPL